MYDPVNILRNGNRYTVCVCNVGPMRPACRSVCMMLVPYVLHYIYRKNTLVVY